MALPGERLVWVLTIRNRGISLSLKTSWLYSFAICPYKYL